MEAHSCPPCLQKADGDNSQGFCTNGIGVIEVGAPCTPQETGTRCQDPPSEITDRRDSAKRVCLMDDPVAAEERCHVRNPLEPQDGERTPGGSDASLDPPRKPKSSPIEPSESFSPSRMSLSEPPVTGFMCCFPVAVFAVFIFTYLLF